MQRQVTTEEIVNAGTEALRHSLYISMPGSVVKYYPQTQEADIQPMVNDPRVNVDTGEIVFEPWSIIHAVPVCLPRMAGIVIAGFLNPQDQVILEAFDLDPGPWRAQGRSSRPVNPADVRRLGGNYWRCTPTDLTGPIADAPTSSGLVIGVDGNLAQIVIQSGSISLGKGSTDHVALANLTATQLVNIVSAFNLHTHPVPGVQLGGPGTVSSAPSTTMPAPGTVASSLIKAQ